MPLRWVVVVPVKRVEEAKTRLDHADRRALALAMAKDTIAAAVGAGVQVVVVTDEPAGRVADPAAVAAGLVLVIPDEPDAGLNPALAHAARAAAERWPQRGVAAIAGDLPALRPGELTRALALAERYARCIVADAAGTGTVLLTARPGTGLHPAFGRHSRVAHIAARAHDLTDALAGSVPGLRRDVDTLADLAEAMSLGVGPATRAALAGSCGEPMR